MKTLIKQLLRENLLNEAKQVGPLYHFTSIIKAQEIINSGIIIGHPEKFRKSDKRFFCVSTTRDKNFWDVPRDIGARVEVRFSLDGNTISNKYPVKPFNFFFTKGRPTNAPDIESEEVIILNPKKVGFEFKNYLIEVTCDLNVIYRKNQSKFTEYDEMAQHMTPILEDILSLAKTCSERYHKMTVIPNQEMAENPELEPIIYQILKYCK